MFPFTKDLSKTQKNFSSWKNSCRYIVLHHTGSSYWTIKWNIKVLTWSNPDWSKYKSNNPVSAHFLIDTNWESYKLGNPTDILWHAGQSEWKWEKDLNNSSVWIEVIWPLPWFTDEERHTVIWLVQHLMAVLWVPKENVIRHKDIAPWRKFDIEDSFFKEWFTKWQGKLVAKEWK